MLFEVSIIPAAGDCQMSDELAEVMKIIDGSTLPYQLTPSGTCIEGDWGEVMDLIKQCHQHVRKRSCHVITTIKIEDEEGAKDKLTLNVASLESRLGKKLIRTT